MKSGAAQEVCEGVWPMQMYGAKMWSMLLSKKAGKIECLTRESPHAVTCRASDEELTQFAVSQAVLVAEALQVLCTVEHVALGVGEEKQTGLQLPAASS